MLRVDESYVWGIYFKQLQPFQTHVMLRPLRQRVCTAGTRRSLLLKRVRWETSFRCTFGGSSVNKVADAVPDVCFESPDTIVHMVLVRVLRSQNWWIKNVAELVNSRTRQMEQTSQFWKKSFFRWCICFHVRGTPRRCATLRFDSCDWCFCVRLLRKTMIHMTTVLKKHAASTIPNSTKKKLAANTSQ